jgi:hypothetical protein
MTPWAEGHRFEDGLLKKYFFIKITIAALWLADPTTGKIITICNHQITAVSHDTMLPASHEAWL